MVFSGLAVHPIQVGQAVKTWWARLRGPLSDIGLGVFPRSLRVTVALTALAGIPTPCTGTRRAGSAAPSEPRAASSYLEVADLNRIFPKILNGFGTTLPTRDDFCQGHWGR